MLNAVGVIARAQFMILRNTFWRGKLARKVGLALVLVSLIAAAFGIYILLSAAVSFFAGAEFASLLREAAAASPDFRLPSDVRVYLLALPSAVMFIALAALVLTSFSTLLASLYLSGDIDMLVVAPVPMRAVFVVKFFGSLIVPYALLLLLVAPALLGYGSGMGFGPAYYIAAIVALLLLPLLPFAIGSLLVMAVVRVIPARRAREIVSLLGGLFGIVAWVVSQSTRQISERISEAQTISLLNGLSNPLLPSSWAGQAINAAGEGRWATLAGFGGLFAALSVGAFVGALLLGEKVYYDGWAKMSAQGGRARRRAADAAPGPSDRLLAALSRWLPRDVAAIVYKDLRVFPRELRNLQQLIFPLAIAGLWTFNLLTRGAEQSDAAQSALGTPLALLAPAGIAAYICIAFSTALGGVSIGREGKGYWQLKVAPISAQTLMRGKFTLAYLPFAIVGTMLLIALGWLEQTQPLDLLRAWLLIQLCGLGVSAIALGMSAAFPKFNWDNPNRQNSVAAGCLSPIFYLVYLGLAVSAAAGLPLLGTILPGWELPLTAAGWLLAILLTAGVVWGFLTFGARRLERIEVA